MHFDREFLKMAMLKQEETFRKQVGSPHQHSSIVFFFRPGPLGFTDFFRAPMKMQVIELHRLYGLQKKLMRDLRDRVPEEPYWGKRRAAPPEVEIDLERPAADYSGGAAEDQARGLELESEIELTLATGSRRWRKGKDEASKECRRWGLFQPPELTSSDFSGRRKAEIEDGLRPPPWLLHCLSLKTT